ncbi:MAG: glycerophosphodiester phosphodiesterase [Chitinophagaceae bacterium]|nr:MAG: glycerophosphodiester phosphodiesterase [Chitinophagaceae bacterium]
MKFFISALVMALISCTASRPGGLPREYPVFFKEGHRGARGHLPENTIPSMKKAIDLGANVIEVDVYITRDGEVLVAHDPYVNVGISTLPDGKDLNTGNAKTYTWHQMNYADIRKIDVGIKGNASFPKQQKTPVYMPLLGELIDSVEAYTAGTGRKPVIYNIEIKANPKFDSIYQPVPQTIVRKVMEVVQPKKLGNRFYLQSFDKRQIMEVKKSYPGVVTAYLVDARSKTPADHIAELGYTPEIYSPHYKLVTPETVSECRKLKMKLVPWTVNTREEIDSLIQMGVDGIITDYPDLLQHISR